MPYVFVSTIKFDMPKIFDGFRKTKERKNPTTNPTDQSQCRITKRAGSAKYVYESDCLFALAHKLILNLNLCACLLITMLRTSLDSANGIAYE